MAQLPGYLRPPTPAVASPRPDSLLEILGALGPRRPASRASADRDGAPVPVATAGERRGVGATRHG